MKLGERAALTRVLMVGLLSVAITLVLRECAPGPSQAADFTGGSPGREVSVEIAHGESGSEIAAKLFAAGVVKSSEAFFRAAVADSRSSRIAPGSHRLQTRIPARIALEQLLDPERIESLIKVRDGMRLSEIVTAMVTKGFNPQEIKEALRTISAPQPFRIPARIDSSRHLEGFLYPAFYSFEKDDSARTIIQRMVDRFSQATVEVFWEGSAQYTPFELLIIASLVESEGTPDVHAKVARVIFNRLSKGMPLQLDSTVHYIFNRRGEIQLSIDDTRRKNSYNTFINRGLPPGPIGSPSIASIKAALNPDQGPWLYFVTVSPGQTRFTDSYDEFLQFKAEYKKNLKAGVFDK